MKLFDKIKSLLFRATEDDTACEDNDVIVSRPCRYSQTPMMYKKETIRLDSYYTPLDDLIEDMREIGRKEKEARQEALENLLRNRNDDNEAPGRASNSESGSSECSELHPQSEKE